MERERRVTVDDKLICKATGDGFDTILHFKNGNIGLMDFVKKATDTHDYKGRNGRDLTMRKKE